MGRKKLRRFADLATFANVFEEGGGLKGRWCARYFKNEHPIFLELACGKAEHTLESAKRFPQGNFIGIDIKGERIWKGATTAVQEGLARVAFIRTRIENLADFFAENEVYEIWITFPDPFPKKRQIKRRLTAPGYLQLYKEILRPGGRIHLKTDDQNLYEYTLATVQLCQGRVCQATEDLYRTPDCNDWTSFKTTYERRHLAAGKTIKYLCFTF
ncbi:MAG: tRNA (guanosine(46)-N7)-methyltransferase TrmB [bacterium]